MGRPRCANEPAKPACASGGESPGETAARAPPAGETEQALLIPARCANEPPKQACASGAKAPVKQLLVQRVRAKRNKRF